MTVEEYLAMERAGDAQHEYIDGQIYLMTGGTGNHSMIAVGAASNLFAQLDDNRGRVFQSNMPVKIRTGVYTYPDISVVCGAPLYEDEVRDTLLNPTVIIEVLSPSTEKYDRGDKFHFYTSLETVQEYLLIAQHTHCIEQYVRQPDGKWLYAKAVGEDAVIELPSINGTLRLATVYRQATFEVEDVDAPARNG
jgi:Uma2 family endonuclease